MTMLTAIVGSIASLLTSSNTDNSPSGADAVRTAVNEIEDLRNKQFDATLGEPDIAEVGGRYFGDPKVVIPIRNAPFESANQLVFDLPEGHDDEFSVFNDLLEMFDLDIKSMEDLDGKTVPMTFIGGNASVLWDEVTDDSEKGGGENPQKKDVEKSDDKKTTESDDSSSKSEEETSDSDSKVNVEETTVSADDSTEEGNDA